MVTLFERPWVKEVTVGPGGLGAGGRAGILPCFSHLCTPWTVRFALSRAMTCMTEKGNHGVPFDKLGILELPNP